MKIGYARVSTKDQSLDIQVKALQRAGCKLQDKGASFKSLEEPWADTTSATGRLVMTFFSGLAEFERDLIRDRTHVGRTAALERGVKFGRPAKMTDEQLKLARRLLKQGKSIRYAADVFWGAFCCPLSISSMICRDCNRPV